MRNFHTSLLTILLFVSIHANAQKLSPSQQAQVNEAFKNTKIAHFKFRVSSMQEVAPLAKIISIEKNQGSDIYAHADKAQFTQFITKGYPVTLIKNVKPAVKAKSKPKVAAKKSKK